MFENHIKKSRFTTLRAKRAISRLKCTKVYLNVNLTRFARIVRKRDILKWFSNTVQYLVPGKQIGWTFSFHSTGTWSLMIAISLMPIPSWLQLGCLIIFSTCKRCSFLESTTTVFWSPATNKEGVAWSRQWAAVTTYERWIYKDTQTYTSLQFSNGRKMKKTLIKDLLVKGLFLSIWWQV